MLRIVSAALLMACLSLLSNYAKADLNTDITSACSTGKGTVQISSATLTVTSTINLQCPPGDMPVMLKGAPTKITCQTGAAPCVIVGSTPSTTTSAHIGLGMTDIRLVGPGLTVAGSEGIRVLQSADYATFTNIRVDNFDQGVHLIGDANLLIGDYFTNLTVGLPDTNTNIAVHLDGQVADVYFVGFLLAGQQRVILSDQLGGTGASATFTNGGFNTTRTPGIAAVSVSSTDTGVHVLQLSAIQDWETACPYLELGNFADVSINGIGWIGDPWSSGLNPAFHITPTATYSWLRVTNSQLKACSGNGDALRVESATAFISMSSVDWWGTMNFVAPARAAFTGNRCTVPAGPTSPAYIGNTTNVRSAGNFGSCPDM